MLAFKMVRAIPPARLPNLLRKSVKTVSLTHNVFKIDKLTSSCQTTMMMMMTLIRTSMMTTTSTSTAVVSLAAVET